LLVSGCITALATPFTVAGALDLDRFRRLLDLQLAAPVQAVVVAGSTGEAASLTAAEFEALLRCAVAHVAGRLPVLAGTGQSSTERTIEQTRRAMDCGVAAALVVTPPYVRPTQDGLVAHYHAVAERGGLPVVLYNVPSRTGVDLEPATVARLIDTPNIVGIKEAKVGGERMQALLALKRPGFTVLSGDDPTAAEAMLAGADGVISVASNVLPRAMRQLCELALDGNNGAAMALHRQLVPLFDLLGCEPNPIPVKALLAELGVIDDVLRLPLVSLSAGHRATLSQQAAAVRALESAAT